MTTREMNSRRVCPWKERYEYVYEYMRGELPDTPADYDKRQRLIEREKITADLLMFSDILP